MGEVDGARGGRGPGGIDTTIPSIARVYDAVLNGKDNYAVDRAVRDELVRVNPESLILARDNREWLIRVVRYLTGTVGIDQFVDCGSGLPTAENTHQVAQRINPDARVVYVDNDPVVAAHGRALLEDNEHTRFASADVAQAAEVLARREVEGMVDFERPVGLLLVGILHHFVDDEHPERIVADYLNALAPGSFVAISHFYNPADGSELAQLAARGEEILLGGDLGSGRFRTYDEILRLFNGLEPVEPGLVYPAHWWPDGPPADLIPPRKTMLGGIARKP